VHSATLDTALYRIEPRPAAGAVGVDADQIEALWIRRRWKLHYDAAGPSVWLCRPCDIVLHDLIARRLGVPHWRMLGRVWS
jgi:L-alanine-DL-glutamate epimerase-like enolase superfamily enzyme